MPKTQRDGDMPYKIYAYVVYVCLQNDRDFFLWLSLYKGKKGKFCVLRNCQVDLIISYLVALFVSTKYEDKVY